MEIRRYVLIVRRRLPLVIAIVVAALVAGWLVTPRSDTFTATSTLYVGSRSVNIDPQSGDLSGDRVAGFDRLIATFGAMAATRPIASEAIDTSGVQRTADQVVGHTAARQVVGTNLLEVSVTDADPAVSRALADAVATSLVTQVRAFEPPSDDAAADEVLSLYESAVQPTAANPKSMYRNIVLAGLFGLLVATAVLALLEHLDITAHSPDDIERELDVPVLAVVPTLGKQLPIEPTAAVEGGGTRPPGT